MDQTEAGPEGNEAESEQVQGKKLPFSGEFSPGQVELQWLCAIVGDGIDRAEAIEKIRVQYFTYSAPEYEGAERLTQQRKRAGNVVIGMTNYGVLDVSERGRVRLTDLGVQVRTAPSDAERYRLLARHVLLNLAGLDVLHAVRVLQDRGDHVGKATLSNQLASAGFKMPRATTKHLSLLNWLRKAGVLPEGGGYEIDNAVVAALTGTSATILDDVESLGTHERMFLRSLARVEESPSSVSSIMQAAEALYGTRFPEDRWQAAILKPLEAKGWIVLERGSRGRGAKSGTVHGTAKFQNEFVQRLLEEDAPVLSSELRAGMRRHISEILQGLGEQQGDNARNVRGVALELLALRMAQYLDLQPRKWRLRSTQTGGAEVDLIVEGTRLLFSRWQIQCKNTSEVTVEDLAKELGLAFLLKSHVVMMVTTGRFSRTVVRYARRANEETPLQVVLVSGSLLTRVAEQPAAAQQILVDALNSQAQQALRQKAIQLDSDDE